MGIKSLTKLLKDNTNNSINNIELYKLSNKTVAIDASLFIYKSLMAINTPNSHILGIYNKTILYLSLNITPIYIFDGKPPEEKRILLNERNMKVDAAKKLLENSNNDTDINKYKKRTIRLNSTHVNDIKQLLNVMGVSYIHYDIGEAEGIASELCRINYVDYVITEDMDTLAFGCNKLVRSCIDKSIKRKDIISIFSLEKILTDLNLSNDQFIELCILCGCDYCSTIPKIGVVKSLDIIKKYKTIDNFIQSENPILPNDYQKKYKSSIKIFNSYKGMFNQKININTSTINIPELQIFLEKKCNLNSKRFNTSMNKINRKYMG